MKPHESYISGLTIICGFRSVITNPINSSYYCSLSTFSVVDKVLSSRWSHEEKKTPLSTMRLPSSNHSETIKITDLYLRMTNVFHTFSSSFLTETIKSPDCYRKTDVFEKRFRKCKLRHCFVCKVTWLSCQCEGLDRS